MTKLRIGKSMAAALAVSLMALAAPAVAAAADNPIVMKMGTPTLNDSQHEFIKRFVADVEKDSKGRIKGEIYPASQLGSIPRMIEGVQFGAIQGVVMPPEFYVGVDPRFEVMSAPALVNSIEHGVRVSENPAVQKLMLGLGADKGLHGVGLFVAQPSAFIARTPLRHVADLKGKKFRVLASQFQDQALERLGATPVAMTLGDVLPAIQQGTIDGALAAITVYTTMKYVDAAKYVTENGQPFIFSIVEMSKKWYDALPKDLQSIIDRDAKAEAKAMNPWEVDFYNKQRQVWKAQGGELISFPPGEQAAMMKTLASVASDLSKSKPGLRAAYDTVAAAAKETR